MKENILLKISGASLSDNNKILSVEKIDNLVRQIKSISTKYGVAIVVGGGNIWRGEGTEELGMDRCISDNMGMLATIMNSLALKTKLIKCGLDCEIYSALHVPRITKEHDSHAFKNDIKNNKIVIFTGGTGMPYFSTDTCCALRALEIGAKRILMAKNGTAGLYDKDPNKHDDALFIENITFKEVIEKKLKVADLTCMTMCEENDLSIHIFDVNDKDSFLNVLTNNLKHTIVKKE